MKKIFSLMILMFIFGSCSFVKEDVDTNTPITNGEDPVENLTPEEIELIESLLGEME